MLLGILNCPIEIDGSIRHISGQESIQVRLKGLDGDLGDLDVQVGGHRLNRYPPAHVHLPRLIHFQRNTHRQRFRERDLNILHSDVQGLNPHQRRCCQRAVLELGPIVFDLDQIDGHRPRLRWRALFHGCRPCRRRGVAPGRREKRLKIEGASGV